MTEKERMQQQKLYDAQKIGRHFLEMLPKIREWTKKEWALNGAAVLYGRVSRLHFIMMVMPGI